MRIISLGAVIPVLIFVGCSKQKVEVQNKISIPGSKKVPQVIAEPLRYAVEDFSINDRKLTLESNADFNNFSIQAGSSVEFEIVVRTPPDQPPIHSVILGFALVVEGETYLHNSAVVAVKPVIGDDNCYALNVTIDAPNKAYQYSVWVEAPDGSGGRTRIVDAIPVLIE